MLNDLNATFEEGKFYAVVGKLSREIDFLIAISRDFRQPNERKVFQWARYCKDHTEHRQDHICWVFQNYNLNRDYLTPLENKTCKWKSNQRYLIEIRLEGRINSS